MTRRLLLMRLVAIGIIFMCGCGKNETGKEGKATQKSHKNSVEKAFANNLDCVSESAEIAAIESSIRKNASSPSVGDEIVKAEQVIINHIKQKGPVHRFVIKEILPQEGMDKASVCLIANPEGGAMAKTDLPGDKIRLSFGGLVAYGEGSRWVPNIFRQTSSGIVITDDMAGGDGSIHRYEGAIPLGVGVDYIFVGDTKRTQRLTFALMKGVGYVYLRGKGKLLTPKGEMVKLGE